MRKQTTVHFILRFAIVENKIFHGFQSYVQNPFMPLWVILVKQILGEKGGSKYFNSYFRPFLDLGNLYKCLTFQGKKTLFLKVLNDGLDGFLRFILTPESTQKHF